MLTRSTGSLIPGTTDVSADVAQNQVTLSISEDGFDQTGTLAVNYDSQGGPIGGFQFNTTGLVLTGASGGAAGDSGFTVSTSPDGVVIGFSFSGSTVPAGSGTLTVLSFSSVNADQTDLVSLNGAVADASGAAYDLVLSGSVTHTTDCAGTYYGDAVLSGCDNTCNSTLENDCAGVCGGDSVLSGCDTKSY